MISMNMEQVINVLKTQFNKPLKDGEERKLIFWTDYDAEFTDDIERMTFENIKVIHLHENNQFFIKHLLEVEDTTSSYLIYTNMDLDSEDNWLFDTVLYSKIFYADRTSIVMNQLKIDHSLRPVMEKYRSYFNAKDRIERFSQLNVHTYTPYVIELAIMNAICRTKSLDFETVLRKVLMETLEDEENRYLDDMKRYDILDTFWKFVEKEYHYVREEKSLQTLLMHIVITAFSQTIDPKKIEQYEQYIAEYNQTNSFVFIDQWLNHASDQVILKSYINEIEHEINLSSVIQNLSIEKFEDADIFPYIDKAIIIYIANSLFEQLEDYDRYINIIEKRRTSHFYQQYRAVYESLYYTVKINHFKKRYEYGLPQGTAIELYKYYQEDLYKMDAYYRKFYYAFDQETNNELLLKLKELVENIYTNWYMNELNTHWSTAVRVEMNDNWSLAGIINQQSFYSTIIESHMEKNERAFVIISDALRYEAGVDLVERINAEIMGSCKIDTMLGVVPSVTKLGMAALLPHHKLEINADGKVFVDGYDSSGIKNREKIIKKYVTESMAIHYTDILRKNKSERRETFKGKKLVYIYHDAIDAVGDDPATEIDTFKAVDTAIEQLSDLVRIIRNDLSGTFIYITSDHGFIYQREPLQVTDLMKKSSVNAFDNGRRYMLSNKNEAVSGQQVIELSQIIKSDQEVYAYVPNATMRYRIQGGGANFVHGGASLQEIVVPLLAIRNKRADQRGAKASKKVDVLLTSNTRRITNSIFNLSFFQNERVQDKIIPRNVIVYFEDEEGNILSNEETIIADLITENPEERMFSIQFALKNIQYDRSKMYYLVIRDTDTDIITEKIPFNIDLGFVSDFDF